MSDNQIDEMLFRSLSNLTTNRSFTVGTRQAQPPTWGQLKKLTQEAEKTLQRTRQPFTPANLLLAMMAVVTCQVNIAYAENFTYWAYVPNPPLLQAVVWGDISVPVCTNDSRPLPFPRCNGRDLHPSSLNTANNVNITLAARGVPLCIGNNSFCLKLANQAWAVKFNHSSLASSMAVITMKAFQHFSLVNSTEEDIPNIPICTLTSFTPPVTHFEWLRCRAHLPRMLLNDTVTNTAILDWSPHGFFQEKFSKHSLKWHKTNNSLNALGSVTLDGKGNETIVWQEGGFTPPAPFLKGITVTQEHIWKLVAASEPIHFWRGNVFKYF
ncbi:endogenous retrovirus group K member 25 Env polyprotein-like [Molossus nigricans]